MVTESVFAIPGLGRLTVDAILRRDYPVIQGVVLLFSFVYVLVNLLIDLLYTVARSEDPVLSAPTISTRPPGRRRRAGETAGPAAAGEAAARRDRLSAASSDHRGRRRAVWL